MSDLVGKLEDRFSCIAAHIEKNKIELASFVYCSILGEKGVCHQNDMSGMKTNILHMLKQKTKISFVVTAKLSALLFSLWG